MNSPEVLLLDEPTAGLSPQLSRDVLQEQVAQLSRMGTGVLLVEQRAMAALEVADWSYVLVNGKCFTSCPARELRQRGDLGEVFLGSAGSSPAI
jgi:branched-chain amino acid transport system ATP-binding protein